MVVVEGVSCVVDVRLHVQNPYAPHLVGSTAVPLPLSVLLSLSLSLCPPTNPQQLLVDPVCVISVMAVCVCVYLMVSVCVCLFLTPGRGAQCGAVGRV